MRLLYPKINPYRTGRLPVSPLHTLYFEECGNPQGRPAVFLHGGPGAGLDADCRRYFNPKLWRVIFFDQRGCGRSTPHAELRENTTWHLVDDIERLRRHLGIERWFVFGGSWGSTLALAYAETFSKSCLGLILRGIFLLRRKELLWFYQQGADALFPDSWEHYVNEIPQAERSDMIRAYYRRLTSPNPVVRKRAAKAWSLWEGATSKLLLDDKHLSRFRNSRFADAFARIECHYFINRGFLRPDHRLLRDVRRIRRLPGIIIQGRYDVVCPMMSAWDLHRAWPEAEFIVVPDAGHSMTEPGIRTALIEATDRFARMKFS